MMPENHKVVVLERPRHGISRKKIDPDALKVLYRLKRYGFRACLVGGAVRDILLGKEPKDFDVVTDARPGQIKKLFANAYLIGRRFRLVHIRFKGNNIIEVATFRKNPGPDDPDMHNTFGTPQEDAFRRDLTINALLYDIANFAIIDYAGGLEDLEAGRISIIGDPCLRYEEDPVRIWRVLRHAARTGFVIEEQTKKGIYTCRHLLESCPGARLFEEMNKDLKSGYCAPLVRLMDEYNTGPYLYGRIGAFYRENPSAAQRRIGLLDVMDWVLRQNVGLSEYIKYSMLFWDWAFDLVQKAPRGTDRTKFLHDAFIDSGMAITLPKARRTGIIQTMLIAMRMMEALETGRMRWALKKRSRYPDAAVVCSIVVEKRVIEKKQGKAQDPFEWMFRQRHAARPGPRKKRSGSRRKGENKTTNNKGEV